jgi:hypothetical protein
LQEIKKIEIKIKKLEKEEKNYEKLMGREVEEYKTHDVLLTQNKKRDGGKGPSGVYLLSDQFRTKLPVIPQI